MQVFLDVSDIIDFNYGILSSDLSNSFFCLSKDDPTVGFTYDATDLVGHAYPDSAIKTLDIASLEPLYVRLLLASHLAQHMRTQLEAVKGYTATVGISTNKLLAKLVGNQNKPNAQTILLPPYMSGVDSTCQDNVTSFMDSHEVGKVPGIGFKSAQKLRIHVLQRAAEFDAGLVCGETKEFISVHAVRTAPGMSPELLERLLGGVGMPQGIGTRIWGLLNGCDDIAVGQARDVPKQISIEDSYLRLDTVDAVIRELQMLARSLLKRMHTDLLEDEDTPTPNKNQVDSEVNRKRWLAHPKTIRLSTRPRPPQNPDGSRNRSFARISKSMPAPNFIFSTRESVEEVADRLVKETLLPLFRKLHPQPSGWNLSLVNIAATNMADAASETGGVGRDISKMFKYQDNVLKHWKIEEGIDSQVAVDQGARPLRFGSPWGSEDAPTPSQDEHVGPSDWWDSDDADIMDEVDSYRCDQCGAIMPVFAMGSHNRWHLRR